MIDSQLVSVDEICARKSSDMEQEKVRFELTAYRRMKRDYEHTKSRTAALETARVKQGFFLFFWFFSTKKTKTNRETSKCVQIFFLLSFKTENKKQKKNTTQLKKKASKFIMENVEHYLQSSSSSPSGEQQQAMIQVMEKCTRNALKSQPVHVLQPSYSVTC